jgi:hypothetical protein
LYLSLDTTLARGHRKKSLNLDIKLRNNALEYLYLNKYNDYDNVLRAKLIVKGLRYPSVSMSISAVKTIL